MVQRKRKLHGNKAKGKSASKKRTTFDGRDISDAHLERVRLQLVMLPQGPMGDRQRKQILLELATVYWARNEYPAALSVWQQLLKIVDEEKDPVFQGMALAAIAVCYAHSGDADVAIEHAQRALVFNPHNAEALLAMGIAYDFAGDYANALLWLERLIRYHPTFQQAYVFLGAIFVRLAQYDVAETHFKKAAELGDGQRQSQDWSQDDESALNGLGNMYIMQGRYEEADKVFKKLINRYPDRPLTYNNLGNCYLHMGRLQDAKRTYEKRVRMRPDDALWTVIGLGLIYGTIPKERALARSKGYFQKAHDIFESQQARMLAGRLIEHDALGAIALIGLDSADALSAWEAIMTNPDSQLVGPGMWSEWLFTLSMLADGVQPPTCIQTAIALHKKHCPAEAPKLSSD